MNSQKKTKKETEKPFYRDSLEIEFVFFEIIKKGDQSADISIPDTTPSPTSATISIWETPTPLKKC